MTQLAAEVMVKGFGPDGPGGPDKPGTLESPGGAERVGIQEIARAFTPAFTGDGVGPEQTLRFGAVLAEGLQTLEHASLIRESWRGGLETYIATRLGRRAVEQNAVERALAGESF
jgi:hypothetical protein